MKIGIIGSRGIPNHHGGFEQFAEFIAPALVERGYQVTVYNSSLHPYKEKKWKGVELIHKNDPEDKLGTVGQFIYDFHCIRDSRSRQFDVILQLGYTSSSIWSFLFPKKSVLVTNMDGMEWKRTKYSQVVRRFLTYAEKWAVVNSDYLIADSKGIQEYLLSKYKRQSEFIPYGATLFSNPDPGILSSFHLEEKQYFLLIARMEPENNIETIIHGFLMSSRSQPLVIIGNHSNHFGEYLHKKYASEKIIFLGAIYDLNTLDQLRHFSKYYFHGHSVGGTNPSLLESMACQCAIIAHDNVFNRSVLEQDAFYFNQPKDIDEILNRNYSPELLNGFILSNNEKIKELYSWEHITNCVERFLLESLKGKKDS
jgi:glycosyltransferase involved in cell wall biosynthesis